MDPYKSQDQSVRLIAALLHDIHMSHGVVFGTRSLRLTCKKVSARVSAEGIGFLTKTLPRLGKAFDKALTKVTKLNANDVGFETLPASELPLFCGEFFSRVFDPTGTVLPDPCAESIKIIRQIVYLFYKYELPYSQEQEQKVLDRFIKTEEEILNAHDSFASLMRTADGCHATVNPGRKARMTQIAVTLRARKLLERVFMTYEDAKGRITPGFDWINIVPRHGPGAVATKQRLWDKFNWTNVSNRIRTEWPLDEYFYSSLSHVCDDISNLTKVGDRSLPARVLLVPKDSRGPRLISCEPVDFQWIQQGVMRSLVQHIEAHPLTRGVVNFTDQCHNRSAAQLASRDGRFATLDLNEASDRVSVDLVRLLFPPAVFTKLMACRSSSTVLPDGKELTLHKFAPMGSALCFPILALTVWSILAASAPDAYTQERILVYGDDVIVPTANAANAIEQLESFGLKVNQDKSCISGLFRESCGMDAFKGIDVTPVRFRTVWSSTPSADVYTSWIAYANSMFDRRYYTVYERIVELLHDTYGAIPSDDMHLACPSLRAVPEIQRPRRKRSNKALQKLQWFVTDVKAPTINHEMPGWSMLLRYFTEAGKPSLGCHDELSGGALEAPFSVRSYTRRSTGCLVKRWR
jgi:hypothetical protein